MLEVGEQLMLYETQGCPYCRKVAKVIARLGVPVERRDIDANPNWAKELVAARSRRTVPVLRRVLADGQDTWLPESSDIVAYLEQRWGSPSNP